MAWHLKPLMNGFQYQKILSLQARIRNGLASQAIDEWLSIPKDSQFTGSDYHYRVSIVAISVP